MRAPSFYSDPHVQFLSQLLEEINGGHLQVPRFQRPMVWQWDRRRELLRSIRDGIPIGAIMVWRTTNSSIECYERLGPHRLALPQRGSTRQYLLDGVQRLSTLYGALHRAGAERQPIEDQLPELGFENSDSFSDTRDFEVFVDLRSADFYTPDADEITETMMPLHLIFNSVDLLKFQRSLPAYFSDQGIKASDEVARSFRDYKIPIIPITTDDVDMATRTFQRINSQGIRMSEAHMIHALTWSGDFDLSRKIGRIRNEILAPLGWQDLDEDPILKACKVALGLDVYKTSAQELSDLLRSNVAIFDEVGNALGLAAEFLMKRCGVPSPDLVPYALQIVVLAEAFRHRPDPDQHLQKLLYSWLWMTTYGELFAGMSGDRVQIVIADMREMLNTGRAKWTWKRPFEDRPLSRSFDFRAARAKAFAFRLADHQDEVTSSSEGHRTLADSGRKGLVQLLPWTRGGRYYSSPANRFLVHPADAPTLREKLIAGDMDSFEREKHLVSNSAMLHLRGGDYSAFVETRLREITTLERRFLIPLVEPFLI